MMITCILPDGESGVVTRMAFYVDCQSRALGENGFQALAGGPMITATLSGLIVIFIALIGYRMILGSTPSLRNGISWAARLGIVMALLTSWPAFQTLVYRVAVEGPAELAAVLLPASGLPSAGVEERVQTAYDLIRLGGSHAESPALPTTGRGPTTWLHHLGRPQQPC